LFVNFPVFSNPRFELRQSFEMVNKTGEDIIWQAVYFDDILDRPVLLDDEPMASVSFLPGQNYPKAAYIMHKGGKRGF
jgi:hypothetical protein